MKRLSNFLQALAIASMLAIPFVIYFWIMLASQIGEPAMCGTDTECAALCQANDPACDGGPQD